MNICFISNFNKTYFFQEIAKKLEKNGHSIYWIVFNSKLKDYLIDEYDKNSVLYLSKRNAEVYNESVGNFQLNELIYGDRVLRHEPEWANNYLNNIQRPFLTFIKSNGIKYIFGETTWAHEVLFHRIITRQNEIDVKYLNPHTIRIPNGRFAFFTDEYQSTMAASQTIALQVCDFSVKKPDYLATNDKILLDSRRIKSRLAKLKRFITKQNIDNNDPMVISSRWKSLKLNIRSEINSELYKLVSKTTFSPTVIKRNYIFFTLHKQPEASIDVIGRYYDDQLTNIINIWRAMPDGWFLLVKEHSNAVGDRSIYFYTKIKKLKGLILISEKCDSHEIIRYAKAVVTVSGTAAYEASLLGCASYTFAPCFFNGLSNCHRISIDIIKNNPEIFTSKLDKMDDENIKLQIIAKSYNGLIGDPVTNPKVMDDSNINNVAAAFEDIMMAP